jgi:hypothetical protein
MDKSKIDRVIDAFRTSMYKEYGVSEEGMVANAAGQSGGFSSSAAAKGPVAGFDTVMVGMERGPRPQGSKIDGRTKGVKKYVDKLIKDREKRKDKKAKKNALKYNPYWS